MPSWTKPGLNSYASTPRVITVVLSDLGSLCAGQPGTTTLKAMVCNRGTNPVQDGGEGAFCFTAATSTRVCRADGAVVRAATSSTSRLV